MPEIDDGKCVECNGCGYIVHKPGLFYERDKCAVCDGTGLLKAPVKCKWCGAVKQPKDGLSSGHAETLL